jgi:hypothetical protein
MHDVMTIEIARRKAKTTEKKFERSSLQKFDKMYSRKKYMIAGSMGQMVTRSQM